MTRILRLLAVLLLIVLPCVADGQRTPLTLLPGDTVTVAYGVKTDTVLRATASRFIVTKCGQSVVLRYVTVKGHRLAVDTLAIQSCAPPDLLPRQATAIPNGCGISSAAHQDSMRKYGINGGIGLDRQQDSLVQSWRCKR